MKTLRRLGVLAVSIAVSSSAFAADDWTDVITSILPNVTVQIGPPANPNSGLPQPPDNPVIVGPRPQRLQAYASPYAANVNNTAIQDLKNNDDSQIMKNRATLMVLQPQTNTVLESYSTAGIDANASRLNRRQLSNAADRFASNRCLQKTMARMTHVTNRTQLSNDLAFKIQYLNSKGYEFVMNSAVYLYNMSNSQQQVQQSRFLIRPEVQINKNGQNLYNLANERATMRLPFRGQNANPQTYCGLPGQVDKAIEAAPAEYANNFRQRGTSNSLASIVSALYQQEKAASLADQSQSNRRRGWRSDWQQNINYETDVQSTETGISL